MSIYSTTSQVGSTSITIETGKMARLADGAVTVRLGDTVVIEGEATVMTTSVTRRLAPRAAREPVQAS